MPIALVPLTSLKSVMDEITKLMVVRVGYVGLGFRISLSFNITTIPMPKLGGRLIHEFSSIS